MLIFAASNVEVSLSIALLNDHNSESKLYLKRL